jgi:hypothetical protein
MIADLCGPSGRQVHRPIRKIVRRLPDPGLVSGLQTRVARRQHRPTSSRCLDHDGGRHVGYARVLADRLLDGYARERDD